MHILPELSRLSISVISLPSKVLGQLSTKPSSIHVHAVAFHRSQGQLSYQSACRIFVIPEALQNAERVLADT
jgi:hypothetical protein